MSELQTSDNLAQQLPPGAISGLLDAPLYSIIIPIHNEADCLQDEVENLTTWLDEQEVDYELWLCENGSTDDTPHISKALAEENPRIQFLHNPIPDYGLAMKSGMLNAQGEYIANFDIDYYDVPFLLAAGKLLTDTNADIVVGSKLTKGSEDKRSFARRCVSLGFTIVLRVLFDSHIDDTHGMKLLKRKIVHEYASRTVRTQDLFDTELIIRARRGGVKVGSLPVICEEKRKARSSIVRRIPRTVVGLLQLRVMLWREGNTK